jgi:hypothetical protein
MSGDGIQRAVEKDVFTRRTFLVGIACEGWGFPLRFARSEAAEPLSQAGPPSPYWWHGYPSFIQGNDPQNFRHSFARMNIHGAGSDPVWGPYAQCLTALEQGQSLREMKRLGARVIVWIEGFGDCMLYAVALEQRPDGSFVRREEDPEVSLVRRNHWNWAHRELPQGNTLRWVGLHNTINDEDFVLPAFAREKRGLPMPTYPDGRPAAGWLSDAPYPLNARIYDACGAKDIAGRLRPACEPTAGVNEIDPATGQPKGPTEGLCPAVAGRDDVPLLPGRKPGDTVYCGVLSVHKDLSAPFWLEYARASIREILKSGLDGVWCDNYSPWDNFGYPPVQKAFGDWSVHRFHEYLRAEISAAARRAMGIEISADFDVRRYLQTKAAAFGAKDPSSLDDPAWRDTRWLDEPMWNAFKAFRQKRAQQDLRAFYTVIHEEADRAGRPDFCIGGNDVPLYGLGWVRDAWQDMINTETTPGWHMGTGSRGILMPPQGKMAVLYRAALEHQKGPFSAAWYYLDERYAKYQRKPGIGKALAAEAFANATFLLCDPENKRVAGTLESHAWWNQFVRENEPHFGRREAMADVGVLFSPDNQLALLAPGGFPDMDRQPHVFGHHGWATALIDGHLPYRTLTDWKLTEKHLAPLRAFIVPDAECLEEEAARALEAWVRRGGRLIVTGPSGGREGPDGHFRRRSASALASRLGIDLRQKNGATVERAVGKGRALWTPAPLGMDYYLQTEKRASLRAGMLRMVGASALVEARLPETVGIFLWRAADGRALFADLVNYDLDADADRVRPAASLTFQVRLPRGWRAVRARTLSPDGEAPAEVVVRGRWARVRLPRLVHFASVKISV